MSLLTVPAGKEVPNNVNVVVEIPANSAPIKYEVDKESGALFVDRFLSTSMVYPLNYGYIPQTLSNDGDPVDALVLAPFSVTPGSVIRCRPIGVLKMTDESGIDAKVLLVPVDKLCKNYQNYKSYLDVCPELLKSVEHFFTHYKDLEAGKWVKVEGWDGVEAAKQEILDSIARYSH